MDIGIILALCSAALVAACIGITVLWFLPNDNLADLPSLIPPDAPGAVFIFDDGVLVDSSPEARALLAHNKTEDHEWSKLLSFLVPRFDNLDQHLTDLPNRGSFELAATDPDSPLFLRAEDRGGLTWLTLIDQNRHAAPNTFDSLGRRVMAEELEQLRNAVATAPILVWRENAAGEVVWANGPYLIRACSVLEDGKDLRWPLPRLFSAASPAVQGKEQRQSLIVPNEGALWYEITTTAEANGYLRFATSADSVVRAETALRDFMQTLTKTFAQLPIGLAIFDKDRKLQLFNPALMDLTHLQADFLSRRPSLLAVLDKLRESKMLPEPKDYRNWRRQIVEMEKAAASGQFEETWNLPDGQIFKVLGRPHPNGALALMIEDISNEMRRTRRYRADLELGQSVVDELPDGIAVFSQTSRLVMSNKGYSELWNHKPHESLGETGAKEIAAHWRNNSAPTKLWTEAEEYIATIGDREPWSAQARLADGRIIDCHFSPLSGGSTLVVFRATPGVQTAGKPQLADPGTRRRA